MCHAEGQLQRRPHHVPWLALAAPARTAKARAGGLQTGTWRQAGAGGAAHAPPLRRGGRVVGAMGPTVAASSESGRIAYVGMLVSTDVSRDTPNEVGRAAVCCWRPPAEAVRLHRGAGRGHAAASRAPKRRRGRGWPERRPSKRQRHPMANSSGVRPRPSRTARIQSPLRRSPRIWRWSLRPESDQPVLSLASCRCRSPCSQTGHWAQ